MYTDYSNKEQKLSKRLIHQQQTLSHETQRILNAQA